MEKYAKLLYEEGLRVGSPSTVRESASYFFVIGKTKEAIDATNHYFSPKNILLDRDGRINSIWISENLSKNAKTIHNSLIEIAKIPHISDSLDRASSHFGKMKYFTSPGKNNYLESRGDIALAVKFSGLRKSIEDELQKKLVEKGLDEHESEFMVSAISPKSNSLAWALIMARSKKRI
ncbi:hypothetical protein HY989_03220 [Candidatus Micrarchaeota archaeon]|nr:hypothetical protein [Candidatus Micrarchaeota archaeon]